MWSVKSRKANICDVFFYSSLDKESAEATRNICKKHMRKTSSIKSRLKRVFFSLQEYYFHMNGVQDEYLTSKKSI